MFETEEGWKDTTCFLKMLELGSTEWVEGLLSSLQEIILSKKYSLNARLGAIKLLKLCLEAGSDAFNTIVQKGTFLDALMNYTITESNANKNNKNADGELQNFTTILASIREGFSFWS